MFTEIVKRTVDAGNRALIVTDRIELMRQSGGTLERFGLTSEYIRAGHYPNLNGQPVTVAMVETMNRRLNSEKRGAAYRNWFRNLDIIIFDECHKQAFNKIFPYVGEKTFVIGASATPYRRGKTVASLDEFYSHMVDVAQINQLVNMGFLATPRQFGVPVDMTGVRTVAGDYDENEMGRRYSEQRVFDGVIQNWWKLTPNTKTLAFSPNIAASTELMENARAAGINARHLDSTMNKQQRVDTLNWLKTTPDAFLCNVGILTTGFDEPSVETIVLYRATKSLPLYLQMCGRGSRIHQPTGKTEFTILDFGNNDREHGLWSDNREWSLQKIRTRDGVAPTKQCPSCNGLVPSAVTTCPLPVPANHDDNGLPLCHAPECGAPLQSMTDGCHECGTAVPTCGHVFESKQKNDDDKPFAELEEKTDRERRQIAWAAPFEQRVQMAIAGHIKKYWVLHTCKNFAQIEYAARAFGYKWPYWWPHNAERFDKIHCPYSFEQLVQRDKQLRRHARRLGAKPHELINK